MAIVIMELGTVLNNRYQITERIGKGAMGTVYKAADRQTGETVAVKVLSGDLSLDPQMIERFRREGEALRQLRHPNIVGLVDTFQHESRQAIVLEYVPGGSLHDLLKRASPLDIPRVKQVALDLCDALIRAHRLNIVHRDIKPENVLMAEDGTPKLTDFGVARLVGGATRLTGTGTQIGTPYYMSPEAWEGEQADAQSDIWSLGIMLYEMLSGQVPFGGETMAAVMNKVLTAPLPDLRSVRPEVPDGLAQIIERMLTRDRSARYQSMREVAADLERGRPQEAPKVSKKTHPAPKPRAAKAPKAGRIDAAPGRVRLPRWALVIGGVIALPLLGVIVMAVFNLCPPAGPWPLPPWCPGSQFTWPFSTPAAATTPAASFTTEGTLGSVLFEDNFDDEPSARWDFQPNMWERASVDGRTVLQNVPTEEAGFASLRGDDWTDYAVQFDFKFLQPDEHNAYYFDLRFRADDCPPTVPALDNYVAALSTDASVLKDESCETQMQEQRAYNDRDFAAEGWHTAQVIGIGNRVRVLVDGQQYFDYTDDEAPHLGGGLSIDVYNGVEMAIDNFRVNEIVPGESAPAATAAPTAQPATENVTGPACVAGETKLFSDDFESGDLSKWYFQDEGGVATGPWLIATDGSNHALVGSDHNWAIIGGQWQNYTITLRVKRLSYDNADVHLNSHMSEGYRYYLNFWQGMLSQDTPAAAAADLGKVSFADDTEWHTLALSAVDGRLEVRFDGESLGVFDGAALPPGGIGIENLAGSLWYDDVLVCKISG